MLGVQREGGFAQGGRVERRPKAPATSGGGEAEGGSGGEDKQPAPGDHEPIYLTQPDSVVKRNLITNYFFNLRLYSLLVLYSDIF